MMTFSINASSKAIMGELACVNYHNINSDLGREWLSEIFLNRLDNRIGNDLNIKAYAFICEQNTAMVKAKREVNIVTMEDIRNGAKGIPIEVLGDKGIIDDSVIDGLDTERTIKDLKFWAETILIDEGYNLLGALEEARSIAIIDSDRNSVQGDGVVGELKIVKRLKSLVIKYKDHETDCGDFGDTLIQVINNYEMLNSYCLKKYGNKIFSVDFGFRKVECM